MAVALECINLIIPISVIEKKYPGGWDQFLKNGGMGIAAEWHDEHLFRTGAMDYMDIEDNIERLKEWGFQPYGEKNGKKIWKDCCVAGTFDGPSMPCDWLVVDEETSSAYMKGTDPGVIYARWPDELRMIGAMIGDIAGSGYERREHNIKYKPKKLIRSRDRFTDDTVLTYGVALGMISGMKKIDRSTWMADTAMLDIVEKEIALSVKQFASKYPRAGYGHGFKEWLRSDSLEPYGSFGNGSAMRVSFAGWYASSLEEAQLLAKLSARITHSHELGIKGAVVVASCIYLLKIGHNKEDIRKYVSEYYNIDFTLDEIRPSYSFDATCEGSVPQAIVAFLENEGFENVIGAAISIGGDSDTIAAIAGSIAELCYPVPGELTGRAIHKLDDDLKFAVKTITEVLLAE